ncbi:MAG: DEAD/DEAH box helicase [Actinobacteria bacterium]|nr:DEAD/DEAH box helicase [Actinomycetota bacterium]
MKIRKDCSTVTSVMRRMGYEGISKITDGAILNIINEFDDTAPDLSKIAQIIIDVYGEEHFLIDPAKRKIFFDYLSEHDAKSLCDAIGVSYSEVSVWDTLKSLVLTHERKINLLNYFGINVAHVVSDDESLKERPDVEIIHPEYGLFEHQENAALKIKKILSESRSRVLLHMPTGAGKTRTAMSIGCDFIRNNIEKRKDRVVVWFADTEELCNQASEEFSRAWSKLGVGDTTLYRLYGNSEVVLSNISNGFLVAGLQKLNSYISKNQKEFYEFGKKVDLMIFDEAHKALADTYQQIIDVFQATGNAALLGLSATPGRSTFDEDENRKFAEFFFYNKVTLQVDGYDNPVEYLQDNKYLARVSYHPLPYEPKDIRITQKELNILSNGEDVPKTLLEQLGIDAQRNILILSLALELVMNNRKIILFACSMANAEALYALLRYKSIPAGIVTSKTDPIERRRFIHDYKYGDVKILVNFGVLTTGFDAPQTNVAIIARPTNSLSLFSQMVGRATRGEKAGGCMYSDIYVINDALPGFRDMAKAFNHWDDAWIDSEVYDDQ